VHNFTRRSVLQCDACWSPHFPKSETQRESKGMIDEAILEERLARLESAKGWSPRVMSRLETLIRSAPDEALFRINPIRFAAERGLAETEAIDLFLHATLVGLFDMDWLLFCPLCSDVVANFRSLRAVGGHFHCHVCQSDFEAALDDYIAVSFTVLPTVRRISFHDPDSLPVEDYAFHVKSTKYGMTEEGIAFTDVIRPFMRGLSRIRPGEAAVFEFDADPGALQGFDMESDASFRFSVTGAPRFEPQRVSVAIRPGACAPNEGAVAPGKASFEVLNDTDRIAIFAVAQFPPGGDPRGALKFKPFLSGKRLLMAQTFRDNFRSEVIQAAEGLAVRDVTLLFTDLKGSTALYERIGDLNAYMQVQRHFERLLDVTVRRNGAVNKTIGDAVMAAFPTAADAVAAALDMRNAAEDLNRGRPQRDFILKIGIHRGAAIAVTLNDRLDYFGTTVNIAARVQNIAGGDEICVTEEVRQSPGVEEALAPYAVRGDKAQLKGIGQITPIYIVGDQLLRDAARVA
jgi:class 3 adenylate cyclase